jgi:hypothetical protein
MDHHFSVHADGKCHLKLRNSGDPKCVSKNNSADLTSKEGFENYIKRVGAGNIKKMIVGNLPPLMTIDKQTLVNNFSINMHQGFEHVRDVAPNDISKFAKYPDQVITLNRKYIEYDQVYCNLWILPKGDCFHPQYRVMNPQVYVFNLLNPPLAIELHSETFPLSSSNNQKAFDKFKYVDQIQDPNSFWINFEPKLCNDGRKLYIPNWTLSYKGKKYELSEITIPLQDGVKLYIGKYNGSDYYYLDLIGAKIPSFDRRGPFCPTIVYVQNGEVHVLRGILRNEK